MIEISSTSNPKIKEYRKLKKKSYRDKRGLFIIEGHHLVNEVLENRPELIEKILTTEENTKYTQVSEEVIDYLSTYNTNQGIIAIVKKPVYKQKESWNKVLVLDNVQDPGNVGSLIRAAKAFEWDAVVVSGADPFGPKSISASQGSIFSIPVFWMDDVLDWLEKTNLIIVSSALNSKCLEYTKMTNIDEMALVLGNEGNGVSKDILNISNKCVTIPIKFESLNVSQAGAILLNEYR